MRNADYDENIIRVLLLLSNILWKTASEAIIGMEMRAQLAPGIKTRMEEINV